MPTNLGMQD